MSVSSSSSGPKPIAITRATQLLVEGKDLVNFVCAHLSDLGRNDVDLHDFGGVADLRKFLAGFVTAPGFSTVRSVGIVRDAEKSATSALQSVRGACQSVGLPEPKRVGRRYGSGPSVTALILPDGSNPGMLETLLWHVVDGSPEAMCVEEFLACVERIPGRDVTRRDKARMHAWIATQERPEVSVGVAAKNGYLDLHHAALVGVRTFLRNL